MHLYTNHQVSATSYAKEEKKANFYKIMIIIIIIIIITITEGSQGYNFQSIFCTSASSFTSSTSHDILYKFFYFTLKVWLIGCSNYHYHINFVKCRTQ